jgi:hypothetical protein
MRVHEAPRAQSTIEKRFGQFKTLPHRARAVSAMMRKKIKSPPLYPEARCCARPATRAERTVRVVQNQLTDLQRQVIEMMSVPQGFPRCKRRPQFGEITSAMCGS